MSAAPPASISTTRRLAVIGAGGAGIAAARRLQSLFAEVVLFETAEEAGGTWLYDEQA
jgi:cation diffusion facilitator CzcD-associated flavoprotein CzcO